MIIDILLKTNKCLNLNQKFRFGLITFLNWVSQILELLGLAVFLPILALILNADSVLQEKISFISPELIKEYVSINFLLILVLFIFIFKNLIFISANYFGLKNEKKIILELSKNLILYYSFYPTNKFYKFSQGEIQRNVITEIKNFYKLALAFFTILVDILFIISVIIFLIFLGNISEILIIFSIIFLMFLFTKFTKRKINIYGSKQSNFSKLLVEKIVAIFNLFRELKLYRKSTQYNESFLQILSGIKQIDIYKNLINLLPKVLFELLFILFVVLFISLNFNNDTNVLLFEKLFILCISIFRILPSLLKIQNNINLIFLYKRPLENIYKELLNSTNKNSFSSQKRRVNKIELLELKKINFNYGKKKILKNFSYKFLKGDLVRITGKSGVGKTTLINIIAGLIKPSSGKIIVNNKIDGFGENSNKFRNIGFLSQDLFLENATIKQNITLNEKNVDITKYKESLKFSLCYEFVSKLKRKDNTLIVNNGENISGGQRQRLILARSYYHAEDLLILDECTSNLDKYTEEKFIKNLRKYCSDLIVVFITHKKIHKNLFNKNINLK